MTPPPTSTNPTPNPDGDPLAHHHHTLTTLRDARRNAHTAYRHATAALAAAIRDARQAGMTHRALADYASRASIDVWTTGRRWNRPGR